MTKRICLTIEGENLDESLDGEWTVTLTCDGKVAAMSGLSGTPAHAFVMAHEVAIENDLVSEGDD